MHVGTSPKTESKNPTLPGRSALGIAASGNASPALPTVFRQPKSEICLAGHEGNGCVRAPEARAHFSS